MNKWQAEFERATKEVKEERRGRVFTTLCISIIGLLVVSILVYLTNKGIALFIKDGVSPFHFLFSTDWATDGAFAMIVTSFIATLAAGILALPIALVVAIAVCELLPNGLKTVVRTLLELLVGIPSVGYGYIGLVVIVPALGQISHGTGFGLLAAIIVLFMMIVPTMVSMAVDSLKAVPQSLRRASAGLGATRFQTIMRVILPTASGGIMSAMIFGMSRAFGEALAVQMVIGNATVMPHGIFDAAATLTSVLTTGIGNTINGTPANDALWSLAFVLMMMSLGFNILVRLVKRKGSF